MLPVTCYRVHRASAHQRFCTAMVSSDDERDGSLRFGWRSQQRMRERERREKQKEERKRKEREAEEEREMEASVAGRITSGDLRERVVAQVIERLKADDVQARLKKQVDSARAAKRQALLSAVEEEGDAAVREARRKEEERLSEDARVADILAENARLVAAAQKRASTK